jgi:hypothetical protein
MNKENKVISIAVGDRLHIEGVGTVELVVVASEQNEQPKQHPLVGKWVRCVDAKKTMLFQENKWYQCVENPEKLLAFIDKMGNLNGFYGANHNHFDLSNPCDFDCNMPEAINPKYKVGDEVVAVDNYHNYGALKKAFYYLGLKGKMENKPFKHQSKAIVFGVCRHEYGYENLYALRDSEGNECVIGEEGIKLAGIDKQEWFDAASRLFDSWIKISGGYVPKKGDAFYQVYWSNENQELTSINSTLLLIEPFGFETPEQKDQFIDENEKDLKTFFHQV